MDLDKLGQDNEFRWNLRNILFEVNELRANHHYFCSTSVRIRRSSVIFVKITSGEPAATSGELDGTSGELDGTSGELDGTSSEPDRTSGESDGVSGEPEAT